MWVDGSGRAGFLRRVTGVKSSWPGSLPGLKGEPWETQPASYWLEAIAWALAPLTASMNDWAEAGTASPPSRMWRVETS